MTSRKKRVRTPADVSPTWRTWAAENLARGVSRSEVIEALTAEGATSSVAQRTVDELLGSPVMDAAKRIGRGARRTMQVAALLDALRKSAPSSTTLPRIGYPGAGELLERYWATNTPVLITDLVSRWPARERWTLDALAARFGDAPVDVTTGRSTDPDYDMHHEKHTERMPLRRYVEMIRAVGEGESNDLYMVANNRNLEKELGALLDDVALPDDLIRTERLVGGAAFWLGPAGTVTPLHHDTSNILFCQVVGRKRYRMIAPTELRILEGARAMYAAVDPERPDLSRFPWWPEVHVIDDVIAPGEALFIPVGWWHHVRALDVSVSLAVNAFRAPNAFSWFVPGSI